MTGRGTRLMKMPNGAFLQICPTCAEHLVQTGLLVEGHDDRAGAILCIAEGKTFEDLQREIQRSPCE